MPLMVAESSTMSDHNNNNRYNRKPPKIQQPISDLDTNPSQIRSKPTISSLVLSTLTPTTDGGSTGAGGSGSASTTKKKNFTSTTFRGLGCTASSQVSVPAAIRSSANWEGKKVRKKKQKKLTKGLSPNQGGIAMLNSTTINNPQSAPCSSSSSSSCLVVPDVWCGPGSGFTTDAASVDCVVSRRPVSARSKVDSDRIHLRERPSCTARRMVNLDEFSFFDTEPDTSHPRMDVFGSRHHRHTRHHSPEGLAEIVTLQSNLMMGGGRRSFGLDRYRDWRLDVDSMSYEELLELGDKIGYVSTGLREDEIIRCLRKMKISPLDGMSSYCPTQVQSKCSICQEEYEADDETGKLDCGHFFHIDCIKQWLAHKKTCPICKTSAISQK